MAPPADPPESASPQSSDRDKPWYSEVNPGREEIVTALRADFPDLECASVDIAGEGWNSFAYLVDHRWLFRFPKRAEVERNLTREIRLLPELARALPVAVPRFEHVAEVPRHYPFLYAGYEKMAGTFAWEIDDAAIDERAMAASCAGFLTALHRFPTDRAAACGCVEHLTCPPDLLRGRIEHTLQRIPRWSGWESIRSRVHACLDSLGSSAIDAPGELTLVHTDLLPDHLLLDARATALGGVIDWGEVRIDDPAWDFAGLIYWLGQPFAHAVLEEYGGEPDGDLMHRARLIALEVGLGDVWYGLDGGAHAYFEVGSKCVEYCLADE